MVGTQVRAQHGEEEDSQSSKEQHAKSPPETCGESCSLTNICNSDSHKPITFLLWTQITNLWLLQNQKWEKHGSFLAFRFQRVSVGACKGDVKRTSLGEHKHEHKEGSAHRHGRPGEDVAVLCKVKRRLSQRLYRGAFPAFLEAPHGWTQVRSKHDCHWKLLTNILNIVRVPSVVTIQAPAGIGKSSMLK